MNMYFYGISMDKLSVIQSLSDIYDYEKTYGSDESAVKISEELLEMAALCTGKIMMHCDKAVIYIDFIRFCFIPDVDDGFVTCVVVKTNLKDSAFFCSPIELKYLESKFWFQSNDF